MLVQRVFFGLLLIAGLVAIFWGDIYFANGPNWLASYRALQYGIFIPLAVLLLALFGTFEMLNLTRSAGFCPMGGGVIIGVTLLNAVAWLIPALSQTTGPRIFEFQLIFLVLLAMAIAMVQIARRRTAGGLGDISVSLMIVVYMGILPSFMTTLRASLPGTTGAWAVLMFVAVVKCTDIGAYFTGLAVGKTKLIPSISPGKTVEGLAGGVVLGVVVSFFLASYLPWPEEVGATSISPMKAAVFGILMALVGQLGDLVESVFKRDAASKNSGRVIPEFGGILDLLDSPAFAAPLGCLLLKAWLS